MLGCWLGAGWAPVGCCLGAGWVLVGCRLGAAWVLRAWVLVGRCMLGVLVGRWSGAACLGA
eukprot:13894449-Alexandrium_andersonii.AAC.1